ncbi:hypothetical protein [Amycolatopsis azurea]|uniref:hypothetical protein n=1 Tax=Amycolatopsis azurea TaxID=36819 RepID=UPI001FD7CC43|nr:hypothetical protein [Amycolatopsis azurea]
MRVESDYPFRRRFTVGLGQRETVFGIRFDSVDESGLESSVVKGDLDGGIASQLCRAEAMHTIDDFPGLPMNENRRQLTVEFGQHFDVLEIFTRKAGRFPG